ncbi:MAG TPA: sulfatase [Gemmatimonadaceae bacterium]|nr:sulfatase [Gemmatimonadaceae bacterium]
MASSPVTWKARPAHEPPAPGMVEASHELPVPQVFHLALWCALAFGLTEGAWMTFSRLVLGEYTLTGIHVAWLASVADIAWFSVLALLLVVGGWVARRAGGRWRSPRVVIGCFLAFGTFTLALLAQGLHPAAGLMLATGVALEGGRQLARRRTGFPRIVRRTTLPLAGLLVLVTAGAFARVRVKERRAIDAAADAAAPAGSPNVLLLVLDTVRDLDLSVSGFSRPTTPNLERFAATGVQFTRAWSPSSWTLSSHASMFTGRFPHEVRVGLSVGLDAREETIAERLARHGWRTGGFVGNLHYGSTSFGLNRGFQHYEDYVVTPGETVLNSSFGRFLVTQESLRALVGYYDIVGRRRAPSLNARLLRWIEGTQRSGRPFFAFVNYYDAHEPYEPPDEYERRFARDVPLHRFVTDQSVRGARRLDKQEMSPAEIARLRDNYDASIAYLDAEIGQLLDSLRARGLLQHTLVIITSDHGEQFGERGLFVHGNSVYRSVMKVPLVLALPGRMPAGREVAFRVNTRSLASTIADLTGTTGRHPMPGHSLVPLLEGPPDAMAERPHLHAVITTKREKLWSVVWDDLQYVRHEDGREELIALPNDSTLAPDTRAYGSVASTQPLTRLLAVRMDSILRTTRPERWAR